MSNNTMKCKCGWTGHEKECETGTFSGYFGGLQDDWDYQEWDNLACPKCGKEVEENKDYDQY